MIGKTVGHYQITEKLGEGGMGVVFKARDTHLDRFAAIKVLPAEKVADPERKRRFIQEAKAASALNHPSIITIYDIDQADGTDFIAMEYVPGKTLDELIPRKGMRLSLALKYAVQIADALARAHGAGIIHRDLKPSNVMVDEHGLVKVLDFGLAKLSEAAGPEAETAATRTGEGTVLGTAAYMSPEQAEGKHIDTRSDIFSFGSMLYEMLTGQRAFRGDTRASTIASILREDPKPISQVAEGMPREVERIVRRCLRKDPEHRFQVMADLRVALEEYKEESDSGALEASGVAKTTSRHRLKWAVGIVVTFILAALLVWFVRLRGDKLKAPLTSAPLTSYPGYEGQASFSPDGQQLVFLWNGEKQDNWDIYIKFADEGTSRRITNHPEPDYSPTWSPDGKRIAFCRAGSEDHAIYLISPVTGEEQRLAGLNSPNEGGRALSWSPDGKRIAVSDTDQPSGHFRILQIDVETRQQRIIQAGFSEVLDCVSPAFSPDGRVLAFIGEKSGGVRDIYIVSSDSRVPRQLTSDETVGDIAWTKDGEEILFSSGKYISDSRIWRMSVSGRKRELLPEIGRGAIQPAVSRDGLRLAYTRYVYESNVWRYDTRGLTQPVRFIESTWIDENPSYSLDGRYIAFISDRSGSAELWRCNSDGSSPIQLTSFHGPSVGYPSWSPDGSQIAFDSNARGRYGIHVVNADGGAVRRLVADSHLNARPSWSRDGKWIYYQSDRSGTMQIWKMSVVGEAYPVQVTRDGGYSPTVSTDGHHIYYSRGPGRIFRISTDGSEDTSIMHSIQPATLSDWPYWGLAQAGIYFADPQGMNWSMKYFEFRSGHVNPLFGVQEPAIGPPAISPDGRWLLYAQVDQVGSDLMLVENFR